VSIKEINDLSDFVLCCFVFLRFILFFIFSYDFHFLRDPAVPEAGRSKQEEKFEIDLMVRTLFLLHSD
jgi:hypothetical protein